MAATGLVDLHNDVCRICEYGGDLLCCDMCTQVFHLSCLLPELHDVPKGNWFCHWCLFDNDSIQKMTSDFHRTRCQRAQERLHSGYLARSAGFNINVEPPTFVYPPDPSEETICLDKVLYAREQLRIYLDDNGQLSLDKMIQFISSIIASDELLSIEVIYASLQLLVDSPNPMVRECLFRCGEGDKVFVGAHGVFIRWFQAASDQVVESTVASKEHIVGVEIIILILKLVMKMDFKSNFEFKKFESSVDLRLCIKQAKKLAKGFQVHRLYKASFEASTYLDRIPKHRKRKKKTEASAPGLKAEKSRSDINQDEGMCNSSVRGFLMDQQKLSFKRSRQDVSDVDEDDNSCISFQTQ